MSKTPQDAEMFKGSGNPILRRYDLDWLRVFAFGLLILFHTGMMFVSWEWHIKNPETSPALEWVMQFLHEWRMPLLFFISGGAVWFAMEKYPLRAYVRERFVRLAVPLIVGMLVVIPPQLYFERCFQGWDYGSVWAFYPTIFTSGPYPQGNLTWHHLWYLPYILAYSLMLLPVCLWLRSGRGRLLLARLRGFLTRPGALVLLALPVAVSDVLLRPYWPWDHHTLIDDWANFASKALVFLSGFVLCSGEEVWAAVERDRFRALGLGVVTIGGLFYCWYSPWEFHGLALGAYRVLRALNVWCWLLALLGLGRRHLRFNHPFLKYATEAVYPWYILHQTVIVAIGYYVTGWNLGLWSKFAVVAVAMIIVTGGLYEFVIRRIPWLRPLFGLKIRPGSAGRRPVVPRCAPAAGR